MIRTQVTPESQREGLQSGAHQLYRQDTSTDHNVTTPWTNFCCSERFVSEVSRDWADTRVIHSFGGKENICLYQTAPSSSCFVRSWCSITDTTAKQLKQLLRSMLRFEQLSSFLPPSGLYISNGMHRTCHRHNDFHFMIYIQHRDISRCTYLREQ